VALARLRPFLAEKGRKWKPCETTLYEVVQDIRPCTVRQTFYQTVCAGRHPQDRARVSMRVSRSGRHAARGASAPGDGSWTSPAPCGCLRSNNSLAEMLRGSAELYRRNLLATQPFYVEIWLEKRALEGVVYPITAEWTVPLMVSDGLQQPNIPLRIGRRRYGPRGGG